MYLDESGDHTISAQSAVGRRYLGLVGLFIRDDVSQRLSGRMSEFKRAHLWPFDPDEPPILHRAEIVRNQGSFYRLQDDEARKRFDDDLLDLIGETQFTVVAVVIDKRTHGGKHYRRVTHPYQYCMAAMMARYCGWLNFFSRQGDAMAEARGGVEDRELRRVYTEVYQTGVSKKYFGFFGRQFVTGEIAKRVLVSSKLKTKPKDKNIAGLQLADILAHPLTRDVLLSRGLIASLDDYAQRIADIVKPKYNNRVGTGQIEGYGRVFLD